MLDKGIVGVAEKAAAAALYCNAADKQRYQLLVEAADSIRRFAGC